jgi:hypothetical protein
MLPKTGLAPVGPIRPLGVIQHMDGYIVPYQSWNHVPFVYNLLC